MEQALKPKYIFYLAKTQKKLLHCGKFRATIITSHRIFRVRLTIVSNLGRFTLLLLDASD